MRLPTRLTTTVVVHLAWRGRAMAVAAMAFSVGTVPEAGATTVISGVLTTQTWTVGGSPYIVTGDTLVTTGHTLTIEAGTFVWFASTDSGHFGVDPARVELLVQGALLVQGTAGSPVRFQSQFGGGADVWYGILLLGNATGSFAHGEVRHARVGLGLAVPGTVEVENSVFSSNGAGVAMNTGTPHVRNSVLTSNGTGILSSGGNPSLEALTVSNNGDGIVLTGASGGTVLNSVVSGNTGAGIVLSSSAATTSYITHSTIHGNGVYGIRANGSNASAQRFVRNSLVTNNFYGIRREGSDTAPLSVTYSDVWGNPEEEYDGVDPGEGSISADPLYVAAPGNLRLSPTSPAIDTAEDLGVSNDRDGTARPQEGDGIGGALPDMGAYETSDVIFADGFEATI